MANTEPQLPNHVTDSFLPVHSVPGPKQWQDPVLHNTGVPPVTSSGPPEGQWEDVPTAAVRHDALPGTLVLRNRYTIDMANYGIANYPEPPGDFAGSYTYRNVGPAHWQGIRDRVQVNFTENQENGTFGYVPQGGVLDHNRATFPGLSTHRNPASGPPAENLRRLASRYVHHPDSQIDMVRMEPGSAASAGRYKVVIVLEMADFL